MRVYLDTSALLKTLRVEPESTALDQYLTGPALKNAVLVTSSLTAIEAERSLRRLVATNGSELAQPLGQLVSQAMSALVELPIIPQVVRLARTIGPATLRSLDAIHLASAILDGTDVIVSYDTRLIDAAAAIGLETASPS